MRLLLKKNQLALILLTLVLMLTVYYITSPFDKKPKDDDDDDIVDTTGRLEELTERRATLREERTLAVLNLDAIIADSKTSIAEKTAALDEKRFINNLTEKELLLELEVISMGFRDCFVHASDTGVAITVVGTDHSVKKANEIIVKSMMKFNKEFENVVVKFQTAEEVMGGVS